MQMFCEGQAILQKILTMHSKKCMQTKLIAHKSKYRYLRGFLYLNSFSYEVIRESVIKWRNSIDLEI